MRRWLAAIAIAGAGCAGSPALAQDAQSGEMMPCGEFLGLDLDAQMAAMAEVDAGEPIDVASEESATAVVAACNENPNLTLADAMKAALRE
jgi:hypothetical protein